MNTLLKSDLSNERKKELRKIYFYFQDVDILNIHDINWKIQYNKNNQNYRLLISVCYLVIHGLLQTKSSGSFKLMDFIDEQRMSKLYEKFILEYYRKEFSELDVSSSQIQWNLDDGFDLMLPVMQSDIMISNNEKTLIIDAKYYSHSTQSQFDVHTIHSHNLYQIFTYVKNKDKNNTGNISGMLLYAKTDEDIQPNKDYKMSGNQISVKNLDLNCDFTQIKKQLNEFVKNMMK